MVPRRVLCVGYKVWYTVIAATRSSHVPRVHLRKVFHNRASHYEIEAGGAHLAKSVTGGGRKICVEFQITVQDGHGRRNLCAKERCGRQVVVATLMRHSCRAQVVRISPVHIRASSLCPTSLDLVGSYTFDRMTADSGACFASWLLEVVGSHLEASKLSRG